MKAMILAAGKGERMLPLTQEQPKPLLKVHNKALIEYHIINLAKAGITEIMINLWYRGEQIQQYLGDGQQYGVKLFYSIETQLLDTGGGVQNALDFFQGEKFVLLSADIYTDFNFASLRLATDKLAHIILVANPEYHLAGDFALNNGLIAVAGTPMYTYANIGIYATKFFDQLTYPYPLSLLLKKHLAENLVTGAIYNGVWFNVGTPMELQKVNWRRSP
jgi:MurNAc alpha-1-phosphate uridylyltransferase